MSERTQGGRRDADAFTGDVRVLLAATIDVADETVVKARQHLAAALKSSKQVHLLGEEPIARAQAAKQVVCAHPFEGRYSGTS